MAHVRAAIGSPVQETNCHPFRRGHWLFVHNGFLADFHLIRRDLMLAIDPELFADVQGSTVGLEEDPITALEATVGLIEDTGRRRGTAGGVQASFSMSDGTRLWAVRYATDGHARSLFASAKAETVRHLYPDNPRFQRLRDEDRLIVSEPFPILPASGRRSRRRQR